jgi:hypothetical protein
VKTLAVDLDTAKRLWTTGVGAILSQSIPMDPQPTPDPKHRSVDPPHRGEPNWTWWGGNHTQNVYHSAKPLYKSGEKILLLEEFGFSRFKFVEFKGGEATVRLRVQYRASTRENIPVYHWESAKDMAPLIARMLMSVDSCEPMATAGKWIWLVTGHLIEYPAPLESKS